MTNSIWKRIHEDLNIVDQPKEKIDSKALKVWSLNGLINGSILLSVALAIFFFTREATSNFPSYIGWGSLLFAIVYLILEIFFVPRLKMRYWRYEIRENEIDIQHGILIIKRTLIPMVRVQHVDTEHGPILRHYGLATLRVSTAASNFHIPALRKDIADSLRGEISTLAQVSDEDV